MFVYRDEKGRITDVRGSVHHAELEELQKESKQVDPEKASGVTTTDFSSVDEDSLAALEAAKAPEPVPEPPPDETEFKSALDEPASDRPSKSALKEEWVDYAVSQGLDRDEAEEYTKQDLVDEYGGN